ncbi:MAG: hypothetical protein ACJ79S_06970 [Gemmatimonadaceae bacterium]
MPLRSIVPAAALLASALAASACKGRDAGKGGDTIAVPAAAVDTTRQTRTDSTGASVTAGPAGAGTTESGRDAATGVDTPITRRLQKSEGKKP